MKMTACVLRRTDAPQPFATSKPISIEEVELDPPGPGELLVRVRGGGLCHSDLSVINGARPQPVPLVLGHEGAGEVVECGPGIRDMAPGDNVVFQFGANCGRCRRCLEGRPQVCEAHAAARANGELMGGGKRLRDADGNPLNHHSGLSCFAEYAVIDRGSAVRVEADIPMDEAALFGCAVMTGVGAVLNTARIRPGDKVCVVGLGVVGLNGLTAYKSIRRGGTVVVAGLAPKSASFTFLPSEIVSDEKGIQGSYMGSCVPVRDIPRYIDLYLQGRLPVDRLIDRKVGFEEVNAGFDLLESGATVRQILVPHG